MKDSWLKVNLTIFCINYLIRS